LRGDEGVVDDYALIQWAAFEQVVNTGVCREAMLLEYASFLEYERCRTNGANPAIGCVVFSNEG
jgi:hypothetical protein